MRKRHLKYLMHLGKAALAAAAMLCPTLSLTGESIPWAEVDFPPVFILQGPDTGKGLAEGFISTYKRNLPE